MIDALGAVAYLGFLVTAGLWVVVMGGALPRLVDSSYSWYVRIGTRDGPRISLVHFSSPSIRNNNVVREEIKIKDGQVKITWNKQDG